MIIEIRRYRIKGGSCDSHLYVDGIKVCDCTENALLRAPQATYRVELRYAREAHRKVPTLIPTGDDCQVQRGRFPIIKVGNGAHTLRNQILVGTFCVSGVVIHSYDAFRPLYDRINNSQRRGNEVLLTIKEVCPPQE